MTLELNKSKIVLIIVTHNYNPADCFLRLFKTKTTYKYSDSKYCKLFCDMGRSIKIQLNNNQRQELENGCRNGKSHSFRTNCHLVLLKSEGRKSKEIASFLGITGQKVNRWLWRYKQTGLRGLEIRAERGRPAILRMEDTASIKEAVKRHRQRISAARVELEKSIGKEFSNKTLERFFKNLTADINESESV